MKKTKLAIGIMTAVLSAASLVGCDNTVKFASDGSIIAYDEGNNPITIKAGDLLKDYYKDSSKYQSIFDAIYSVVVQNYFTVEDNFTFPKVKGDPVDVHLGAGQVTEIKTEATRKVEDDKNKAKENADNNGTNYNDEFKSILSSKGAKDEDELWDKYVEELKKETFDKNFYKYKMGTIKNGDADLKYTFEEQEHQLWNGYFEDMLPYHVSHILVKLEDGSGTNFSSGTISEADAKRLYTITKLIAEGDDTFGKIASQNSDKGDEGSANDYGDLGIMDYSTSYVNEFKLGVYAYENFFGKYQTEAKASHIKMDESKVSNFKKVVNEAFYTGYSEEDLKEKTPVPTIDYDDVFVALNDASEIDKDEEDESVLDDSASFFPRNIIYNKYLNRHSFGFITRETAKFTDTDPIKLIKADELATTKKTSGFVQMKINGEEEYRNILCVKVANNFEPVLCTRAGSGYEGIHFIVINRSPFDKEGNGVSLDNYYTTYYPEQEDYYPIDGDGKQLTTYINFSTEDPTEQSSRAESFISTLKSYNSDRLNKYIFEKYFEMEKLHFADSDLDEALHEWIYRGFKKQAEEKADSWDKTWNDYIDTLTKQNSERKKLVSEACRLAYVYGNSEDSLNEVTKANGEKINLYNEMKTILETEWDQNEKYYTSLDKDWYKTKEKFVSHYLGEDDAAHDKKPKKVVELFKQKGGLCNDGKAHF